MPTRILTLAGELAVWWAATLGLWLLTLSSVDAPDLMIAVPSALVCAVLAIVARRTLGGNWRRPGGTAHWALRLPLAVVSDAIGVLVLPFRPGGRSRTGEWVRVPVLPGAEPRRTTKRTVATVLVSSTPGSVVVNDDNDTGELLVHSLISGPWSMQEVVRK